MNRLTKNWGQKIYFNFSCYCWRSLNYMSLRSNGSPGRKFISLGRGEYSRGGSTQERFLREGSAPRSSPLPFCLSFNYDRTSTSIKYLVWNFAYIFDCCSDPMTFKLWINHKTTFFFLLFHSHKMHLLTLFGLFLQTKMIDFPTASKSLPSYIHEAQIRYSFWAEPPRIGHCREYPPPPPSPPGYVSRIFPQTWIGH